jgi:hypothetical protein
VPIAPSARVAVGLSVAAFGLALGAAAIVPGPAWSPASAGIEGASVLTSARVLHASTGLTVAPEAEGVLVSTGDGGGVGLIDGLDADGDAPIRVHAGWFRGAACWEIGTRAGRPASYVDDNGIRLDDGMLDRVRGRAWPLLGVALAAALFAVVLTRGRRGA